MKKILKEPFLHFVILGIALFLLYGLVNDNTNSKDTIIINDFDVSALISKWEMQWKRSPTEQELQKLIGLNIKQEIYYQEALKMNFDHNDEIIKRRLAQKMKFLSNDIAGMVEPSDEELKGYYQQNPDKYMAPATYSLYQIPFSRDKRKDNYKDALETLQKFPNANFEEMKSRGDLLPISYFFENVDIKELGLQLGSKFSTALEETRDINKWIGPIASGFGYHLVFITEKNATSIATFESVKKNVIRDYGYDRQNEMDKTIYQELKKKYDIDIDINSKDFDPTFVEYLETEFNK